MTEAFIPDRLEDDGEHYEYQAGVWTNKQGMRVSLDRSQAMTMKFYELNGRGPKIEPKKKAVRANSKAAKAKAEALRNAIAKAAAAKSADEE